MPLSVLEAVTFFRQQIWEWMENWRTAGVQQRYERARNVFDAWCIERGVSTVGLGEKEFDVVLARCVLDAMEDDEEEHSRQLYLDMMSTLQRRHSMRFRMTQHVLSEWQKDLPPVQAEAIPEEAVYAAVTIMLLVLNEPMPAFHTMLCFIALLRIGESLNLNMKGLVTPRSTNDPFQIVVLLKKTKRGFDERVVIHNKSAVLWIMTFIRKWGGAHHDLVAPCSYAHMNKVLKLALQLLGMPERAWRTHGLRRGGATALLENGVPFDAIRLYGRWASESSAREYLRRGGTALTRLRGTVDGRVWERLRVLSTGAHAALGA